MASNDGPQRPGTPSPVKTQRESWSNFLYRKATGISVPTLQSENEELRTEKVALNKELSALQTKHSTLQQEQERNQSANGISQGGAAVGGASTVLHQTIVDNRPRGRPTNLQRSITKTAKVGSVAGPAADVLSNLHQQDYVGAFGATLQTLSTSALTFAGKGKKGLAFPILATSGFIVGSFIRAKSNQLSDFFKPPKKSGP